MLRDKRVSMNGKSRIRIGDSMKYATHDIAVTRKGTTIRGAVTMIMASNSIR